MPAKSVIAGIIAISLNLCLMAPAGAQTVDYLVNGDFSQGFTGWTQGVVKTWSAYPKFTIRTGAACLLSQTGNPYCEIDVPGTADGYIEQQVTLPAAAAVLAVRSWVNLDPTTAMISLIEAGGTPHLLDSYTPPSLVKRVGSTYVCSGNTPVTKLYSLAAFAGQTVKLRFEATSPNYNGAIANFDDLVVGPGTIANWQGGSGAWSNPANWLGNQVPGADSWLVLQGGAVVNVDIPNAQVYALSLDSGSGLTVQPGQDLALYGPAVNNGAMTVRGDITSYANGIALVQNGSLIIDPDVALKGMDSGGGDFAFAQTGGTTQVNGTLDWGSGAINVQDGNLNVATGGTVALQSLDNGLTQTGGGITVNGTLAMRGFDCGGSDLAILGGSCSIGPGGTLEVGGLGSEGSSSAAATRPMAAVQAATPAGSVSLDGTLAISLAPGYQPKAGDSFKIMNFGSRSGDFRTVTGANLGGGLYFKKVYTANSLTLVVARAVKPAMNLLLLLLD